MTAPVDPSGQSAIPEHPTWLDKEAWKAFIDMRKAKGKRAPFTPAAEKRLLWNLDMLRAKGNDPTAMLWQSVVAGWSDVYPVKHQQGPGATVESFEVAKSNQWIQAQAEASKTALTGADVAARVAAIKQKLRGTR